MRKIGSDWKRSRRLGYSILETGVELKKRNYAPGQHGVDKKRKSSEYGKQLTEKQKLRDMYGVNERQFRRLFTIASASDEVTGTAFIKILESRLDNLVYRMGFARTRKAARQLVNHGHVTVNGSKVDIPSYLCNVNDVIAVKEDDRNMKVVQESLASMKNFIAFVQVDVNKVEGTYLRTPERKEVAVDINEALVIEYYNRLL